MEVKSHGGQCCGMTHIHNLGAFSQEALAELNGHIEAIRRARRQGCIEMVLIDQQMMGEPRQERIYGQREHAVGGWAPALSALGFRIVSCFQNSNHGNWCNVLHLKYDQPAVKRPRPFEWRVGRRLNREEG